jgi:hypothetical protein
VAFSGVKFGFGPTKSQALGFGLGTKAKKSTAFSPEAKTRTSLNIRNINIRNECCCPE